MAALGGVLWLTHAPSDAADPGARGPAGRLEHAADAVDPRLAPIVASAKSAAAQALTDAAGADVVAVATDEVAAKAAASAADGRAAATKAGEAATKACKAPSETRACATAEDGSRYEGAQACRADGCGPEGYGIFTDTRRGWESQGEWKDWSLVLGCDSMKGVVTYCGQQVASAWSGFGISYNAEAAAISGEWRDGAGKNPLQLDYPTGSRMRGDMTDYELDGLGVYERSDKQILRGSWRAGKLVSGVVFYPATQDVVSGRFVDGAAQLGVITYRDGRVFAGEIEDGPALAQARPHDGVLYAPDGSIAAQGAWRDGMPVAAE